MLDERGNVRRGFVEQADYDRLIAAAAGPALLWLRAMLECARFWGWRKSELLNLRVNQVDMRAREVVLYAGTTKSGKGRTAEMSGAIFTLVGQCILGKRSQDRVFTRRRKPDSPEAPVQELKNAWHSLCVRAGLGWMVHEECYAEAVKEHGKDGVQVADLAITQRHCCPRCGERVKWASRTYKGLLFHDLRRSAARDMVRSGSSENKCMAVTGHSTNAVFKRYDIVSKKDLQDTTAKLEQYHLQERKKLETESLALFPVTTAKPQQSGSETTSDSETLAKPQTTTLQ
jgi:integrase